MIKYYSLSNDKKNPCVSAALLDGSFISCMISGDCAKFTAGLDEITVYTYNAFHKQISESEFKEICEKGVQMIVDQLDKFSSHDK